MSIPQKIDTYNKIVEYFYTMATRSTQQQLEEVKREIDFQVREAKEVEERYWMHREFADRQPEDIAAPRLNIRMQKCCELEWVLFKMG